MRSCWRRGECPLEGGNFGDSREYSRMIPMAVTCTFGRAMLPQNQRNARRATHYGDQRPTAVWRGQTSSHVDRGDRKSAGSAVSALEQLGRRVWPTAHGRSATVESERMRLSVDGRGSTRNGSTLAAVSFGIRGVTEPLAGTFQERGTGLRATSASCQARANSACTCCASAPRFCAATASCRPRSAQPFPGCTASSARNAASASG